MVRPAESSNKGLDGEDQHPAFKIHMVGLQERPCGIDLPGLGFGKELRDREFKPVDIDQHAHHAASGFETHDPLSFSLDAL
jgi:hypothetical protein